tara:strand:- start:330 stop:464 length:135 start_codon:yes stop_codon:yes gene_type:complete
MHTKIKTLLFSIVVLVSCADKSPKGSGATFLVTSNVRGQLDPCG